MSIVIQKKKFLSNQYSNPSDKVNQFLLTDPFHEKYLKTLSDFEANFRKNYGQATLRGLKETLESFYNGLKVNELFISDLSKHGEALNNNIDDVVLVKKTSDIVNMLADYIVDRRSLIFRKRNSLDLLKNIFTESRDVTLFCLKILKLFSMINVHFAFILSNKERFVAKIFELMLQDNKVYFKQVLGIQEAMIAVHPEVIEASIYPYIRDILLNIPRKYFARFSRVIALLVLENSEKIEFKELSPCYSENKMVKVHGLLLSIPDIVEAYTVILESIKEIAERLIATTPETLHKTIRYLKESTLIKDSGINLSFLKPIFEQANVSEAIIKDLLSPKFMVKFMVKKSNVTEILFILSNLLSSKRKIEVQNKLRHINFVDRVITPMFDLLFHSDIDTDNSDDSNGSENEEYCGNPLTTARIQLLRIIINFCDRDSPNIASKELLLSSEEKAILNLQIMPNAQNLYRQQNGSTHFFDKETLTKNAFESVQKKGLINKIIMLIHHFPPNSSFCFWLATCVESFLRGFHEPHQIFVAHTGLIHRLIEHVLTKQMTKSTNIQISYDLIGEIIKFSKYNLAFLDALCQTLNWTDLLFEHTSTSIIDANVFLRGLILSFEKLDYISRSGNDMEVEYANQSSKIRERFVSDKVGWFHRLIAAVDPAAINQDNICCINTTLIIAMFADQNGLLETYVNTLDCGDEKKGLSTRKLIENFCGVLDIWNKYYASKTKDCFSLQYTSSIPFYAFQLMQERLQNLLKQRLI